MQKLSFFSYEYVTKIVKHVIHKCTFTSYGVHNFHNCLVAFEIPLIWCHFCLAANSILYLRILDTGASLSTVLKFYIHQQNTQT